MGLETFSAEETAAWGPVCSFFSSSELLSRRRVPALTGDGGLASSIVIDFGRYLGNADEALRFRERRVEVRRGGTPCGVEESDCLVGVSASVEDLPSEADTRLRVTALDSGVVSLLET